jgi:hypothetical protein
MLRVTGRGVSSVLGTPKTFVLLRALALALPVIFELLSNS